MQNLLGKNKLLLGQLMGQSAAFFTMSKTVCIARGNAEEDNAGQLQRLDDCQR
jgi:hypothetical protein